MLNEGGLKGASNAPLMPVTTAEGASQTDREGKQLNDGRVGAVRKDHIERYEINDEIIVFIPLFIYFRSIYVK